MVMLAHVRSAFSQSNGTYGSPRMTRELQDDGFAIGRRRTARLMRENGLRARQKRQFKRTTDSEHAWPIAPNIIDQDFAATAPNQKWGVDISYVWTREGWLYLAVVIDLFSRKVVGWAVGDRLHRRLALAAPRKALTMRRPPEGLIHHSDRGSQYCSVDYQAELRRHGITISMSGKGNCFDNPLPSNCVQAVRYWVLFLSMALRVMRSFRMVATIASLKGLPASRSRLVVAARCPLPERAMVSAAR